MYYNSLPPERQGFTKSPDGRGTIDILRLCLFTVFICCWTVVHPDISHPSSSWWDIFLDGAIGMLAAAIAPEVMIYAAYYQYIRARASFKKLSTVPGLQWTKNP